MAFPNGYQHRNTTVSSSSSQSSPLPTPPPIYEHQDPDTSLPRYGTQPVNIPVLPTRHDPAGRPLPSISRDVSPPPTPNRGPTDGKYYCSRSAPAHGEYGYGSRSSRGISPSGSDDGLFAMETDPPSVGHGGGRDGMRRLGDELLQAKGDESWKQDGNDGGVKKRNGDGWAARRGYANGYSRDGKAKRFASW